MDPFDDLYARVIVEHALAVRAGQSVLVEAGEAAEPLARAVHRRVLEAGGHPSVQLLPGRLDRGQGRVRRATTSWARPIRSSSPWYERVDCRVTLLALANVEQLAHVDPARAAASETGRLRAVHVLRRPRRARRGRVVRRAVPDRRLRAGRRALARRLPRAAGARAQARPARSRRRLARPGRAAGPARRAPRRRSTSCASWPRAPTCACASAAAAGSAPRAATTCPTARSSPARTRTPPRAS